MLLGLLSIAVFILLFWRIPTINCSTCPAKSMKSSLSIIIPARNEEQTLPTLLTSIATQTLTPFEVMVVDDASSDQTKAIALRYGVRVIDNPPLPKGWLGKSWACYQGALAAQGETLLFVDADTTLLPDAVERLSVCYNRNQIITLHPYHHMKKWYEKLSSLFHLVVFSSTGVTHIASKRTKPSGGFGQCLICLRDTYFELGGHASVRGEIVENFSFVKRAMKRGYSCETLAGTGVISMRMYPDGVGNVFRGWAKSISSGAKKTSPVYMMAFVFWISLCFSFLSQLYSHFIDHPFLAVVLYSLQAILLTRILKSIGNFRYLDGFLFPLHLWFFICVCLYSLYITFIRKTTSWKGRNIVVSKDEVDS